MSGADRRRGRHRHPPWSQRAPRTPGAGARRPHRAGAPHPRQPLAPAAHRAASRLPPARRADHGHRGGRRLLPAQDAPARSPGGGTPEQRPRPGAARGGRHREGDRRGRPTGPGEALRPPHRGLRPGRRRPPGLAAAHLRQGRGTGAAAAAHRGPRPERPRLPDGSCGSHGGGVGQGLDRRDRGQLRTVRHDDRGGDALRPAGRQHRLPVRTRRDHRGRHRRPARPRRRPRGDERRTAGTRT